VSKASCPGYNRCPSFVSRSPGDIGILQFGKCSSEFYDSHDFISEEVDITTLLLPLPKRFRLCIPILFYLIRYLEYFEWDIASNIF
jgi:hypothetical protein